MEKNEVSGTNLKVLNRDVIKYIAMITMLLNHVSQALLMPGMVLYDVFECIGYFTAPVMCYFLVEGYDYTRSKRRYGLRLFLFAIISQIPFGMVFPYGSLNMIYTLLCCFLILVALEQIADPIFKMIVFIVLMLATAVGDWPLLAPLYTLFFYYSKGSRKKTALSFVAAYALFVPLNVQEYIGGAAGNLRLYAVGYALLSGVGILAAGAVILFFYNGKRAEKGKPFSKWFFYIFYPAHLMILYLIKVYMIYV